MADLTIPTITLAPRAPKGHHVTTVTTNVGVTVFVTDEVTVYVTKTVETTFSVFDTSFIHVTTTVTNTSTTTATTTTTKTIQPLTPAVRSISTKEDTSRLIPLPSSTLPTPSCSTLPTHAPVAKHIDPFLVLSIALGVFILFLLALMGFLVRRFYKMYRAERVLRKQLQTEGTEMPEMRMKVNEEETHVVGEE